MALEKLVSEANRWADESALGFTVSGVEEGTRKISFRAPCGSFYVTVPENVGSEEWVRVLISHKPGPTNHNVDRQIVFSVRHVLKAVHTLVGWIWLTRLGVANWGKVTILNLVTVPHRVCGVRRRTVSPSCWLTWTISILHKERSQMSLREQPTVLPKPAVWSRRRRRRE